MDNYQRNIIRKCILGSILIMVSLPLLATRLVDVRALDNEFIMIHFKDGEVIRRDDGNGNCAFMGHCHSPDGSKAIYYGDPLNIDVSMTPSTWQIKSDNDSNYNENGKIPVKVFRKSKLNGMSISHWDHSVSDYVYDHTMEHILYLRLPTPMQQGKSYTIETNANINADSRSNTITFDIFSQPSEAIHINLVGYSNISELKSADLYQWMGDGGARDYSSFEGKKVFLYNVNTSEKLEAGLVEFWKQSTTETNGYNFTRSDVWNIDFSGKYPEGTYRIAVEDVGSSQDFEISSNVYYNPYKISTQGFFYMRLGQNSPQINPRPREPLFIPGVDNTTIYISTLHPYHPDWQDIRRKTTDPWDHPKEFEPYSTGRTNDQSWGGHSDAYDWDKRLPHVSIIYDMLLPFIITGGIMDDDNLGIAESGNGIPDILDEARYEVDAWLRMRDGKGYAHGRTCPYSEENRIMYQGGTTAIAAWANALNSAMLAEAFRISGHKQLMQVYLDSALVAFHYADNLEDPMLDRVENDGVGPIRGRDFKMMAAAYLYNLTENTTFENIMKAESIIDGPNSNILNTQTHNQIWGVAAYLTTPAKVNYPELWDQMKSSIINEALRIEAWHNLDRPSRRGTCNASGYFWTIQNMQRSIIAHAVSDDMEKKDFFLRALILEADWSLGRNPTNMIQMTTASTPLEGIRSVEFAYTSGYNDGTPGLHPGHTPYWNMNDWQPNMIMGRPSWMAQHGHPSKDQWPVAELVFNTDYVWSHTEFTPQQTLRGKMALYAYLYGLAKKQQ